jgi:hypothetical protein
MANIFGNIFDEEEKKAGGSVDIKSSNTDTTPSKQGGSIFGDVFADSNTAKQISDQSESQNQTAQKEEGFLSKALDVTKGVALKAVDAGKSVIKWGLDLHNKLVQRNEAANFEYINNQKTLPLRIQLGKADTEEEKQAIINDPKNAKYKPYASYDEYQQTIPLIKFFNSDTGKKTVGFISEESSNIPLKKAADIKSKVEIGKDILTGKISLKDFANIREIADREYEEAYAAFLTERNDPENPTWQKFLYEVQDTGVQSAIGILLSMGTAYLTKSPRAGTAISSAYYTALSADEQIQSRGKVDSLGNIAIDVVGDQMLNKVLGGVLESGTKSTFQAALKSFGVEGSTEVLQSLTKYANDYGNAKTQEDKDRILAEAKQYVVSGAIAMEFGVGGLVGAGAGAVVGGVNPSSQPNDKTTKPKVNTVTPPQIKIENTNIDEAITQLTKLEATGDIENPDTVAEITQLRDVVTDYTKAFNDKTVFVPSEVSTAPLIDITTSELPSGKVVVKFSANTEQNGIASMFDFTQQFSTQEEATKNALDAVIAWAQTQEAQSPEEQAQLEKILDYAKNPRPLMNEQVDQERMAEDTNIQEKGEVDSAALDTDLAKVAENAPAFIRTAQQVKVGEVIQYVPADAVGSNKRQIGQVVKVNAKSITLRDNSGRTKRVPIDAKVTEDIGGSLSDEGRAVFDTEKAPRKKPAETKKSDEKKNEDKKLLDTAKKESGKKSPKKSATVQVVVDAVKATENITEQADTDVNAIFMAMAFENPLESIKSEEYKAMKARGYELKNENDPSQGFTLGRNQVIDGDIAGKALSFLQMTAQSDPLIREVVVTKKNIRDPEGNLAPAGMDPLNRIMYINASELNKDIVDLLSEQILIDGNQIKRNGRTDSEMVVDYMERIVKFEKSHIENLTLEDAIKRSEGLLEEVSNDLDRRAVERRQQEAEDADLAAVFEKGKVKVEEKPREVLAAEKAIDKIVEKFRKDAKLLAGKYNSAGVRQRAVKDAVGNVMFMANSFKLTRAKADMARQAADMKSYARQVLYDEDPIFRDAVDSLKAAENGDKQAIKKLKTDIKQLETSNSASNFSPGGYASAIFSIEQINEGGQPEKEAAEIPITLGQLDSIRPVELPELVDIARELMGGKVPQVTKLREGKGGGIKMGDFMPAGDGRIRLQEFLFKQENLPQAAKTLAHEMGHLIDYLPDGNIKRGNLLGRLATLRGYMASTFGVDKTLFKKEKGAFPKQFRANIKNDVTKKVLKLYNVKFGDFITGKVKEKLKAQITNEIAEEYKVALDAALEKGGYIKNEVVKKELLTLTRWWKPYDPAMSESYDKYRQSPAELYADAISVLFNAPRRLQDIAPTFYNKFFEGLDAKPDVRDAYFEVQALLSGDREAVVQRRREGVKRMFKEGDYKAIDLHNRRVQEQENRRKQYWSHFKHTVIDKNYQIIDRVKKAKKEGKIINPDENPEFFLEERNYIGGKIKALFEREFNTIYSTLNENDIAWEDFGELLFYERIAAGDRSDVANPRGITPEAAKELISNMEKQYGEARWPLIQDQVAKFRAANKKVMEEAFEAGLYKKDLYDQMQENPAYVTFQVLDHLETGMTSRVYKSLGTLKDVTNPADATMLKIVTTIRAAERNKVTKTTVDFLKQNFASEITEAKYARSAKGRFPMPSKLPNQELVTYLEQGVVKGYYVDPYIAETINNQSVGANAPIVPIIRFMNTTLFRPLFISFNLGFQSFNLIRDFVRFYKNTPSMTFLRAMQRYGQAGRIAKVRAFGLSKNASAKDIEAYNLLNKLEEEKVLSVTFNDMIRGESNVDKQIEKILADTGVKDFQPKPTLEKLPKFAKPIVKALDKTGILKVSSEMLGFIENLGNFIETLPKAAGVYELGGKQGDLTRDQKSFIRRKIGSPDFLAGGTYKPITNEVFLFSNAIIQGIRSDIEVAVDPTTRSGWWWKTAKISLFPKMLMMAILYGALGDEYKELMESASEYDRTNYTIIPLGRDSTGKPVYFRLPADETSRFLGGMLWKVMTMNKNEATVGRDLMDVMSYTGGQIPSISPAIGIIASTAQFLSGQNPYDAFRGRQVLSDTTFKAGGAEANKAFLGWQFQQLGGGVFYKFYHEPSAQREEGKLEKFFNAPIIGNVLGRFIRVSDYGQLEQLKAIEKRVEKEAAQETLDERKLLNKYIDQAREKNIRFSTAPIENALVKESLGGRAPATKDELEESKSLVKKFRLSLRRGNADPKVTALIDAGTNDIKIELLKEIRKDMSESEFATLRRDLITNKIVSGEVFNDLMRSK